MNLQELLEEAKSRRITKNEALYLFKETKSEKSFLKLLETAGYVRDQNVGRKIEFWPFALSANKGCSTNPPCQYCGMASDKVRMGIGDDRIASEREVAKAAKIAEKQGFKGVQLGGGCSGNQGAEAVTDSKIVKSKTSLKVFVNYGYDMSEQNICRLKELGIEMVGCSFETINQELFSKIKPGDSLEERKRVANLIDENNLGLASGLMIGIGETYEDRVKHLFYLRKFKNLKYVYVSGFYPIPGTPMEAKPPATSVDIAKTIAITRLIHRSAAIGGSFGRDDQLQLWILAGINHRNIHGMFEPKNRRKGVSWRFKGETKEVSENFVFVNSLPIYSQMATEIGLTSIPD